MTKRHISFRTLMVVLTAYFILLAVGVGFYVYKFQKHHLESNTWLYQHYAQPISKLDRIEMQLRTLEHTLPDNTDNQRMYILVEEELNGFLSIADRETINWELVDQLISSIHTLSSNQDQQAFKPLIDDALAKAQALAESENFKLNEHIEQERISNIQQAVWTSILLCIGFALAMTLLYAVTKKISRTMQHLSSISAEIGTGHIQAFEKIENNEIGEIKSSLQETQQGLTELLGRISYTYYLISEIVDEFQPMAKRIHQRALDESAMSREFSADDAEIKQGTEQVISMLTHLKIELAALENKQPEELLTFETKIESAIKTLKTLLILMHVRVAESNEIEAISSENIETSDVLLLKSHILSKLLGELRTTLGRYKIS